jgi:hypothetical protein
MQRFEFPRADTPTIAARSKWVRITVFVIFTSLLSWLVLSRSLVAYLEITQPEEALFLRPGDPAALVSLADRELNFPAKDETKAVGQPRVASKRLGQLRQQVETALATEPLNAHAYRVLAQLAEVEHDPSKTEKLMQAAARHSLSEAIAAEWMMRKSFENKNYSATAFYADIFLRAHPQYMDFALPALTRMAENKEAAREIEKLLAANPPWRPKFFSGLDKVISDARVPLDLFLKLKDTTAPPTTAELGSYLSFLLEHKLYPLAYLTWFQFLTPEQLQSAGYLFNGSFETRPSGLPFDWVMPRGVGMTLDIAPRPESADKHALFMEFGQSRVDFPGVSQTVLLPPGTYRFKGSFKGEIIGPRGLQWSVSCLGGAAIGASQMFLGATPVWRDFEFPFSVPESGCPAQSARLVLAARSASEQLVSGSIWFDALSILRLQPNSTK